MRINLGSPGSATVNVLNGSRVSMESGVFRLGTDSPGSTSTGTLNVSGNGSLFHLPISSLHIGNDAQGGNHTVNVSAGGMVNMASVFSFTSLRDSGSLVVDGGSFSSAGRLIVVGGSAQVFGSGSVLAREVSILGSSASSGEVTLSGIGSNLSTSDLTVDSGGVLNVQQGSEFQSLTDARLSGDSSVTVIDSGSRFNVSHSLDIANGSLNILNNGLVSVGGTTSISSTANVNLSGGRFEFGTATHGDLLRINASSGELDGNAVISGVTNAAAIIPWGPTVDSSEIRLVNDGLLHGSRQFQGISIENNTGGEIRTLSNDWLRFAGSANVNRSEINNFGGTVEFAQDLTNESTGFIGGRGVFIADGGWTNNGVMAFSGTTDILGDIQNLAGGQMVTSGGVTTTIFDDLVHNGAEIRTSAGSQTVIFGEATGAGSYTGAGTVFFEGDLRPGNSPGMVLFEGDVVLGNGALTQFELSGTLPGEFDQLVIAGALSVAGDLSVEFIDGFLPSDNMVFEVADVGGFLSGQFMGLPEGALIGNFSGHDLFISYVGGDGNDIAFFTSAIPEPSSFLLVALAAVGWLTPRRRRNHLPRIADSSGKCAVARHNRQTYRHWGRAALAGVMLTVISVSAAHAQTDWTGNGDGINWSDSGNWNNGMPSTLQSGTINSNSPTSPFDVFLDVFASTGSGFAFVSDLTIGINDSLSLLNNERLIFAGGNDGIQNDGLIQFQGTGNTWMRLENDLNIGGAGTITLNGGFNAINGFASGSPPHLIHGTNHTINGAGRIGSGLNWINNGLIHANVDGESLLVQHDAGLGSFTNNGIVRASGGGVINLGTTMNFGGTFEAINDGDVNLFQGEIHNATFVSDSTSQFTVATDNLVDFFNLNNAASLSLSTTNIHGTLNNSRSMDLRGASAYIDFQNDVSLTGGGTVNFEQDGLDGQKIKSTGGFTLTNVDNAVTGTGTISVDSTFAAASTIAPSRVTTTADATGILEFGNATSIGGLIEFDLAGDLVDQAEALPDKVNVGNSAIGTLYDQINVFDTLDLNADVQINVALQAGFIPQIGDFFDILTADQMSLHGNIVFDFPVINGFTFDHEVLNLFDANAGTNRDVLRINYGTVAVPEPGTTSLLMLTVASVVTIRRSRRRIGLLPKQD